ncbi:S-layer homology domain-containing protein [Paenibacillus beijingensis]|uniref:SLH domain-containing protein n=1 Tax=Paenibacillus beijingensis TaxID=1126833 RepID=A0A0D5NHX6_9BACL|nr:S-layer homology domain-containing protein [Paenibacillus beijingensis]AJY74528.1 hypothetical protein VN24_08030 [Paenibacillus beijingensis]
MLKRYGILFLLLTLVIQFLPAYNSSSVEAAAAGYFTFPSESSDSTQPRVTTDGRVTLTGSVSNIGASSISYSIYQIVNNGGTSSPTDDQIGSKKEGVTGGIYLNGYTLTVSNLELFSGLNRITFKGLYNGAEVTNSIYITYHDGPVFYNLAAKLNGQSFDMNENVTTVVHSSATNGRTSADIAITGNAPNASKVTVSVNGSSRSYSVSSTNNYQFTLSPLTVKKGKNQVEITVTNNNQSIVTTRDIAFYNGEVTFYDVNINDTQNNTSAALEKSPNFSTGNAGSTSNLSFTGTVIVPNNYQMDGGSMKPHPDPGTPITVTYQLDALSGTFQTNSAANGSPADTDAFFIYDFTRTVNNITSALTYDHRYSLDLKAFNEVTKNTEGVNGLAFTLKDSNQPYIDQINYLPGYKTLSDATIASQPLEGQNIYDSPLAMEVLIGNSSGSPSTIAVTGIKNASGTTVTTGYTGTEAKSEFITKSVDGVNRIFERKIYVFTKLPFEGTQTVTFQLNGSGGSTGSVTFNMLFGPFLQYTSVYDGMSINFDSTNASAMSDIVTGTLSSFKAKLSNLNDTSEIRYAAASGQPQTMFFYINNTQFAIEQDTAYPSDPTRFKLTGDINTGAVKDAIDFLKAGGGEYKLRFVYKGSKNTYENTISIYLNQLNIPVIPAQSDTVYPYSTDFGSKPLANDPNFPKSGSVFTTKEPKMNIYGTFDFLDFGTITDQSSADAEWGKITNPADYILKIEGTTLKTPIVWTLNNQLKIIDSSNPAAPDIALVNPEPVKKVEKLTVMYDVKTQTFSFILDNQDLSTDGSSSVYNFYVYNNGEAGARAGYRLEVDPTALPYKVLRPLTSKRIVNQNYAEIVIDAPNATSVVVNKVVAEKTDFDADNDGVIDYRTAYKAVVSGLKAGENKLKFTIQNANDSTSDTITVTYAPTNIPGAAYMEPMKNAHKVFDSSVQLSFPKGTTLIRKDYNVPQELKNQVFTGHQLLFGIANPEDGVVDRHEFEAQPANFDLILASLGNMFSGTFSDHFSKASNVFWIDAGLADNPATGTVNDPLKYGIDPYQFPASGVPSYADRPEDREMIVSKRGTLTLSYDPKIVDGNGTIITVFRFDPKKPEWVNAGGIVDTKKNTVTVPFSEFGYYVVGQLKYSYTDITSHPYARNYLEALYAKGIMNAAGADEFGANLYINRGEFATMIVKALQTPLNYNTGTPQFDDVTSNVSTPFWDFKYIETAARDGFIRGLRPASSNRTKI